LGTRKAFTLVETLVAIAVIAILLGITLPMLRGALRTTDKALDLANLRSTHQQFYEWGVEHKDNFVNQGPPGPGERFVLRAGERSPGYIAGSYGMQDEWWTWTLGGWLEEAYPTWHPRKAPKPEELEALNFERLVGFTGGRNCYPSDFRLSRAMLFDPRMFAPGCEGNAARFARFVRWTEAVYPASKALLHWTGSYNAESESPVSMLSFVDGSSRSVDPAVAVTFNNEPCMDDPFGETPLGILGLDVR
jgi:prepilin-type N-terminal cleavage/methylation domain-containing protein